MAASVKTEGTMHGSVVRVSHLRRPSQFEAQLRKAAESRKQPKKQVLRRLSHGMIIPRFGMRWFEVDKQLRNKMMLMSGEVKRIFRRLDEDSSGVLEIPSGIP